jgi:6-phosphofructokinase
LKVTASSHRRAFLIEVMGRNCSYLALAANKKQLDTKLLEVANILAR